MTVLVGLDFETFYDPKQKYSLRNMTQLEYVRDRRFECFGASIKLGTRPAVWATTKTLHSVLPKLRATNRHITGLAHNSQFDGLVLLEEFGIRFDQWICTMAMAQSVLAPLIGRVSLEAVSRHLGLGEKDVGKILLRTAGRRWHELTAQEQYEMGSYACDDTEKAVGIFRKLYPELTRTEMDMISWTIESYLSQMFTLDEEALTEELERIQAHKARLLLDVGLDERDQLMSAALFKIMLEDIGVIVEMKAGKNGLIPALAKTDQFMKDLAEHEDDRVQALTAARLGHKSTINETRCERLLGIARTRPRYTAENRIGAPLRYAAAHTKRWGGADNQNWQNLERRNDKLGTGRIRRALCALANPED